MKQRNFDSMSKKLDQLEAMVFQEMLVGAKTQHQRVEVITAIGEQFAPLREWLEKVEKEITKENPKPTQPTEGKGNKAN